MKKGNKNEQRIKRHKKVRTRVIGTALVPRLCVFRSNGHIYGQLIDDAAGRTLAQANDVSAGAGKKAKKSDQGEFAKIASATAVGQEIAKLALAKGLKKIVFDRGGYLYTGRVKALADGAREGGLEF
jgi:large subunit ribosomal protein L18